MKKITLCLTLVSIANFVNAQTERIDTDRPDQTESAVLVPKKNFQFETGVNYQKNDDFNKEYLLPTLLSKYGLSNRIELRLITTLKREILQITPSTKLQQTSLEQVEVGSKISLFEEKKLLPKTSLLFHVGVPGLASYETDGILFNTRLSMQHTITKNIGLGYNLGVEFEGNDDPVFIYTIAPGINFGKNWYAYIEAFGSLFEHPQHNIDGGLAYYLSNDFKIDISSGIGISGDAPKYYISLGASIRFK